MTTLAVRTSIWQPPGGSFWGSSWRDSNAVLEVRDAENGELLGAVADTSPREVEEAIAGIARELETHPWPTWQRREALSRAAELVTHRSDLLAEIISREGSKTIREARVETGRATETLRLAAEQADRLSGETLPLANTERGQGRFGWYTREPVGIVAAITPFNDPLNLVAHKLGPALIAGNGVVLKPAEATPFTALALAEILLDAGVPRGRFAVLPGSGPSAGEALVRDPRVDLVSFTGGHRTGDAIARAAGAKRLVMELGGNCAVLVLADADASVAAQAVVAGAFGSAGQNCVSVQRVLVAEGLAAGFLQDVVRGTQSLRVGSKADPETDVGPLINETEARRIQSWVEEAKAHGATVVIGGHRSGAFYEPTVLTGVPDGAKILTEEVFGPVVVVETFREVSEAVDRANGTAFGLQAGVFTRSLDVAMNLTERLRVGAVLINDTSDYRIDAMPFGGPKRSGIGREGVRYAVDAMTEPKVVIIKRTGDPS
jgi:glyceraldehyde-3-phosphate dehydrogenase (NADP+)